MSGTWIVKCFEKEKWKGAGDLQKSFWNSSSFLQTGAGHPVPGSEGCPWDSFQLTSEDDGFWQLHLIFKQVWSLGHPPPSFTEVAGHFWGRSSAQLPRGYAAGVRSQPCSSPSDPVVLPVAPVLKDTFNVLDAFNVLDTFNLTKLPHSWLNMGLLQVTMLYNAFHIKWIPKGNIPALYCKGTWFKGMYCKETYSQPWNQEWTKLHLHQTGLVTHLKRRAVLYGAVVLILSCKLEWPGGLSQDLFYKSPSGGL